LTTKKNSNTSGDRYYRVPCPELDVILLIKKLSETELKDIYFKLKKLVKSYKKDERITKYMGTLAATLLFDPSITESYKDKDGTDIYSISPQNPYMLALRAIYECIVDIYIPLRIEFICSSINKINPFPRNSPFFDVGQDFSEEDIEFPLHLFEKILKEEEFFHDKEEGDVGKPRRRSRKAQVPAPKSHNRLNLAQLKKLEKTLKGVIIGQDHAIECLINRLKLISVGFESRGAFFFVGRTGVGKTELAKLFGKHYSGNFCKINCAEYSNGHEVTKLIGSPPGYIGSNEKSFLTTKAEAGNNWVFLFDEVEKANEKLFNILLSLLDDGTIVDSMGKTLDFSQSIFIFTSNQGLSDLKESYVGFSNNMNTQESVNEFVDDSIKKLFTPEFRNRLDEKIFFNDLTEDNVKEIISLNLKDYPIEITDEITHFLMEKSYSKEYGVRELKRKIKQYVAMPLAEKILEGYIPEGNTRKYNLKVEGDTCIVSDIKKRGQKQKII